MQMQDAAAATSWRTRRLTRLGILGGLAFALFGFSQSPAQAALLDANCPGPPDDGYGISANARAAQTFTAIHTGTVVRAQTDIEKPGNGGDWTMQILGTDASGAPVNGVLGSGTTPDSAVAVGDTTLSVTFSTPAPVVAGQTYALVTSRPDDFAIRDHSDQCPGAEFDSPNQTDPFGPPATGFDQVFSIFVNPPNAFTVGKQKGKKLSLNLPGAGTLTVADASAATAGVASAAAKKKSLKSSSIAVAGAGTVTVKLKLTKRAKQRLSSKGKLSARAAITFTPSGGEPNAQTKKLKFKRK
jgi:hypothetical protein